MKAIELERSHSDLETAIQNLKIVEKPIPSPNPGEVLVKMEAAPCNPSDLLFLQGEYGYKKKFPTVPGWEGAGTVIKSGGGALGWWLKGKRVAFALRSEGDGTWAEYCIADAHFCIPLKNAVESEQGSMLIINPLTALGMVETAIAKGHKAIIQNAACSQLGRMVQTLVKKRNIPLINIVRKNEQAEQLKAAGEKWILNSSENSFKTKLKDISHTLNATIAFDAVGGDMTGILLNAMPLKSNVLVYGVLSGKPCEQIRPMNLIFEAKKVEGFLLTDWIQKTGFWGIYQAARTVQNLIGNGEFEAKIQRKAGYEDWIEALLDYSRNMTAGKVILKSFKN